MSNSLHTTEGLETTGRYVVTFREGAKADALGILKKSVGLSKARLMSSADFVEKGVDTSQVPSDGGVIFENLGIAVVNIDPTAVGILAHDAGEDSDILAVEPEGIMHALDESEGLTREYMRGFRDASSAILSQFQKGSFKEEDENNEIEAVFNDTASLTWGLQATKVSSSKYSGKGIKVAVLDTGFDLKHPDFSGRNITSKSFIPGIVTAQDGHGHGTHCTGTACGSQRPRTGRRYGVAYKADIFIGKVLTDAGSGGDLSILAGIEWAVANKCHVISMSLGADVPTTSIAYETAGNRALSAGTLIVAAAGNNAQRTMGNYGFVGRPANSRTFLAVGALDKNLAMAYFSARDTVRASGTAVDIIAPGVAVYSSWPMPTRYNSISGTSMATPHVAGIAALWAQATSDRGVALWHRLYSSARTLSLPVADMGRGLVQAP